MTKNLEFTDKLRSSGLRPTKQRLKICEVLFDRDKTFHFTINDLAKDISEQLNEKIVNKDLKRNMPACIIYTSGTSGNPKGVVLSHGGILSNCEGAVELLEILTKP